MSIPFTQFLRPDGAVRSMRVDRPPDIEALVQRIIGFGYRFECEELATGQVSLTVTDPVEEEDIEVELSENGPPVLEAVDRLVRKAAAQLGISAAALTEHGARVDRYLETLEAIHPKGRIVRTATIERATAVLWGRMVELQREHDLTILEALGVAQGLYRRILRTDLPWEPISPAVKEPTP